MQQMLLRKAGLLGILIASAGLMLGGCVDEPNPPVVDHVTSLVRFVQAIPDAPTVDIWVDGARVASNQNYKSVVNYMVLNAGNRFIRITPAGSDTSQAIFRQLTTIRSFTKNTMIFYGFSANADVNALVTQERFTYSDETKSLKDSAAVKLINVRAGETVTLNASAADGTPGSTLLGPVLGVGVTPANATDLLLLSSYKKIVADNSDSKFFVMSGATEVISFTEMLKYSTNQGYRYTFILIGATPTPEVLRLQDDPS